MSSLEWLLVLTLVLGVPVGLRSPRLRVAYGEAYAFVVGVLIVLVALDQVGRDMGLKV
jgi:hypothetical protein